MYQEISIGAHIRDGLIEVAAYDVPSANVPIELSTIPFTDCFDHDIQVLIKHLRDLEDTYLVDVVNVGVVLPDLFNPWVAKLPETPDLASWCGRPVRQSLKSVFPLARIAVGNKAQGQALSESILNPKLYKNDFLLFSVGCSIEASRVEWRVNRGKFRQKSLSIAWDQYGINPLDFKDAVDETDEDQIKKVLVPEIVKRSKAILETHTTEFVVLTGSAASRANPLTDWVAEGLSDIDWGYRISKPDSRVLRHYGSEATPTIAAVRLPANAGLALPNFAT